MKVASAFRSHLGASIAAIATIAAGTTGAVISTHTHARLVAAQGDAVLLADIANETGDTLFDRSLAAAATVALQQSNRVSVYPRVRVPVVYRLMEISNPATPLSFDLAREVAQRDRVRFVVGLRVTRRDAGYLVSAQLADVMAKRTVPEFSGRARAQSDVLDALDGVMVQVRRALGESGRQMAEHHVPLPGVTTASLAALQSYADGGGAWGRGEYRLALEYWQRAIDLDTSFAMAYGALGGAEYYLHNRDDGERNFDEAFRRTGRLTEWELLELRARRADARHSVDSAIALARLRAERFPNVFTYLDLGGVLLRNNRDAEAFDALRKVIAMDSARAPAWIQIATLQGRAGHRDSAVAAYRHAVALDSTLVVQNNINNEFGGTLVELGNFAAAESLFRRMTAVPRLYEQSLGYRSLGFTALWQGRLDEAVDNFRRAAELTAQQPSALSEGRNRLLMASVDRAANRPDSANAQIDRVMTLIGDHGYEPAMLGIVAYQCALLGRGRDVDAVARLTHARARADDAIDQGSVAFVDGVADLAHHRPDSALAALRRADAFPWNLPRMMLRAEAFNALGQRDSARTVLVAANGARQFGSEGEDDWLRSAVLLGDALLEAHDTAGATRAYQSLLKQWRDAPGTTPDVALASRRLTAIAAHSGRH